VTKKKTAIVALSKKNLEKELPPLKQSHIIAGVQAAFAVAPAEAPG